MAVLFTPTTVIGIGTSGRWAVAWLSRILRQEFGDQLPEIVRLYALDTDVSSLEIGSEGVRSLGLGSAKSLSELWNTIDADTTRERQTRIRDWYPSESMKTDLINNLSAGAGGIRAVGRLSLWSAHGGSEKPLHVIATENPASDQAGREAAAKKLQARLGEVVLTDPHYGGKDGKTLDESAIALTGQVVIVGSATGGTASGALLDVVEWFRWRDGPRPKVKVLVTLPPWQSEGDSMAVCNAAALLMDLHRLLNDPGCIRDSVTSYWDGVVPAQTDEPPADLIYLLGPQAPGSDPTNMVLGVQSGGAEVQRGLALIAAYWLYAYIFGGSEDVISGGGGADLPGKVRKDVHSEFAYPKTHAHLRAMALRGAVRPCWLLAELVTRRFLESAAKGWRADKDASVPVSGGQEQAWFREGEAWMRGQIDALVSEIASGLTGEVVRADARDRERNVAAHSEKSVIKRITEALLSQPLDGFGRAQAGRLLFKVPEVALEKIRSVVDDNYSLVAADHFLRGMKDGLEFIRSQWRACGALDSGGRAPTVEGLAALLRTAAQKYAATPPVWLLGPSKEESYSEVSDEFCRLAAAYYLNPFVFAAASADGNVQRSPAASALIANLRIELNGRLASLSELEKAMEKRSREIRTIGALTNRVIEFVWYEEGMSPEVASERVVEELRGASTRQATSIDEQLREGLRGLWAFLGPERPTKKCEEDLLACWTDRILLGAVTEVVNRKPLGTTTAASARLELLLALHPTRMSMPYLFPSAVEARGPTQPIRCYAITQGEGAPDGFIRVGHRALTRNIELRYGEATGFSIFDIQPFWSWLPRLLECDSFAGSDPYLGVRAFARYMTEVLIGFLRDLVVEWDGATAASLWPVCASNVASQLSVAGGRVVLRLGGRDFDLSGDDSTSRAIEVICGVPRTVNDLWRLVQAVVRTVRVEQLTDRWKEKEAELRARGRKVDELKFDYGVRVQLGLIGPFVRQ